MQRVRRIPLKSARCVCVCVSRFSNFGRCSPLVHHPTLPPLVREYTKRGDVQSNERDESLSLLFTSFVQRLKQELNFIYKHRAGRPKLLALLLTHTSFLPLTLPLTSTENREVVHQF